MKVLKSKLFMVNKSKKQQGTQNAEHKDIMAHINIIGHLIHNVGPDC